MCIEAKEKEKVECATRSATATARATASGNVRQDRVLPRKSTAALAPAMTKTSNKQHGRPHRMSKEQTTDASVLTLSAPAEISMRQLRPHTGIVKPTLLACEV